MGFDLPPDVKREIARRLGPRDLARFAATSREHRDLVAPDLRKWTVSAARARRATDVAARDVAAAFAACAGRPGEYAKTKLGGVHIDVMAYVTGITFLFSTRSPAVAVFWKDFSFERGTLVPDGPIRWHKSRNVFLDDPPKSTVALVNSVVSKAVEIFNEQFSDRVRR